MTDEAMSPLRRRMIEDMRMRRLAPKTQKDYIRGNRRHAAIERLTPRPTVSARRESLRWPC
jgi:hypothetical protein